MSLEPDEPLLIELEERGEICASRGMKRKYPPCSVCNFHVGSYCCPGCGTRTCSVSCCNDHKRASQCSGKRTKSCYVPITNFNTNNLVKDCAFLQDAATMLESSARLLSRHFHERISGSRMKYNHSSTSVLKNACAERGIDWRFCPVNMSIRRDNTTRVVGKKKRQVAWRIRWVFTRSKQSVVSERVLEDSFPRKILEGILKGKRKNTSSNVPTIDFPASVSELHVLFPDRSAPANSPRYFRINPDCTLKDNLANTTIIEYPTFLVLTNTEVVDLCIIERPLGGCTNDDQHVDVIQAITESKQSEPEHCF